MPAAVSPNARGGSAGPDDLDNLLDYDGAVQDFWKDLPDAGNGNAQDASNEAAKDIDEEIRVTKKRKPNPKLDDARLLSDAGIPKLRRITKDRLKFHGKGHEFADMSRMLNLYQLWLDDLYPKAKFKDALTMVEKLGHSKRMQVSRRAWIEETKASQRQDDNDDEDQQTGQSDQREKDSDTIFGPGAGAGTKEHDTQEPTDHMPAEDDLDALFAGEANTAQAQPQPTQSRQRGPFEDDNDENEPDEDELGELLAEDRTKGQQTTASVPMQKGPIQEDPESDQDDLDALFAEESSGAHVAADRNNKTTEDEHAAKADNDFADEEDAMRDLDW